jgi:tetratricopeptide (TPR) repeat protein
MTMHRKHTRGGLLLLALLAAGCGSRDPDVLLEKGRQAFAGGEYRTAARALERASRLDPNHAEVWLWCGTALWKAGKLDAALTHFIEAARLDPVNPIPLEYASVILAEQEEFGEAAKRLNEAFRRLPDSPRIMNAMGVISVRRGNIPAAQAQFQSALKLSPRYPPALYNAALLSRDSLSRPDEARQLLLRYLEVAPDGDKAESASRALNALGPAPAARPSRPAPRAEVRIDGLMRLARAAINRRDYDEAAVRLREAAEAAPASPEPLWILAKLYDGKPGQDERAEEAYRDFLHGFAEDPRAAEARLRVNFLAGRKTHPVTPSAPPPGLLSQGELVFHKAELRNPREAAISIQRGSLFFQKRDFDRALFEFKRSVELDDSMPEGYFNLGLVYWNRRDYEHARPLFQTALARKPEWADARCMLARVYLQQQLGIKAVEHLNEILKTEPSYADAYYELGRYYRQMPSHKTQVRNWYGHYLQLAPKGVFASETSAWLAANP